MKATTFREKVLLAMYRQQMTWSQLAERCGYHRVSLSRWFNGRQESDRLTRAIALALGLPTDEY